jgi:thiol-disulfide isomerase/thioredoxin
LLIDFWGVWCVDRRREVPVQVEAYKRFRSRKFEILGLDSDEMEKLEEVKTFLAKNKISWTQARFDSIKKLIETDGKVLVLDQNN